MSSKPVFFPCLCVYGWLYYSMQQHYGCRGEVTMTQRVLFLCTHNSARSQMAEGWLRHLAGDRVDVHSAGTEATRVRPLAVRAMAEVGVDISGHTSKTFEPFVAETWDDVITVCDD